MIAPTFNLRGRELRLDAELQADIEPDPEVPCAGHPGCDCHLNSGAPS